MHTHRRHHPPLRLFPFLGPYREGEGEQERQLPSHDLQSLNLLARSLSFFSFLFFFSFHTFSIASVARPSPTIHRISATLSPSWLVSFQLVKDSFRTFFSFCQLLTMDVQQLFQVIMFSDQGQIPSVQGNTKPVTTLPSWCGGELGVGSAGCPHQFHHTFEAGSEMP